MLRRGKIGCSLFSAIYIVSTARVVAFTMVIAVVYYAKLADIGFQKSPTIEYCLPTLLAAPHGGVMWYATCLQCPPTRRRPENHQDERITNALRDVKKKCP